jgi:hypothetical protein
MTFLLNTTQAKADAFAGRRAGDAICGAELNRGIIEGTVQKRLMIPVKSLCNSQQCELTDTAARQVGVAQKKFYTNGL